MNLEIHNVTFDCADPDRLSGFWAQALGYEKRELPPEMRAELLAAGLSEEDLRDRGLAEDPDGEGPRFLFRCAVIEDLGSAPLVAEGQRTVSPTAASVTFRTVTLIPSAHSHRYGWVVAVSDASRPPSSLSADRARPTQRRQSDETSSSPTSSSKARCSTVLHVVACLPLSTRDNVSRVTGRPDASIRRASSATLMRSSIRRACSCWTASHIAWSPPSGAGRSHHRTVPCGPRVGRRSVAPSPRRPPVGPTSHPLVLRLRAPWDTLGVTSDGGVHAPAARDDCGRPKRGRRRSGCRRLGQAELAALIRCVG